MRRALLVLALVLLVLPGCLRRGRVNQDFGSMPPDLEIVQTDFLSQRRQAIQGIPYGVDVLVRNNGAVGAWVHAAYTAAFGEPADVVRLGGRSFVPAGSIVPIRMYFDVQPEWTRDRRFRATVFVADPDRRGEGRAARIWVDANMANHLRDVEFGVQVPIRPVRGTVVRVRPAPSSTRSWNFAFDFFRQTADGVASTDATREWPGGGELRPVPGGGWTPIGITYVFDGLVDGDRVGLNVQTVQDDGSTLVFWFDSVSFYVPAPLWGRTEYRRIWASGTPPPSAVTFELDVLLETVP